MTSPPFTVVVQRRDGTTQTVFRDADLRRAASEAFLVADKLCLKPERPSRSPARAVTIECDGQLELSITVTPGRPL